MPIERVQDDAAALLDLALDDEVAAQRRARALLDATTDPWWSSVAHHALGLVLRTAGDLPGCRRRAPHGIAAGVTVG